MPRTGATTLGSTLLRIKGCRMNLKRWAYRTLLVLTMRPERSSTRLRSLRTYLQSRPPSSWESTKASILSSQHLETIENTSSSLFNWPCVNLLNYVLYCIADVDSNYLNHQCEDWNAKAVGLRSANDRIDQNRKMVRNWYNKIIPGFQAAEIDPETHKWIIIPTLGVTSSYRWEMDMEMKPLPDCLMRVSSWC